MVVRHLAMTAIRKWLEFFKNRLPRILRRDKVKYTLISLSRYFMVLSVYLICQYPNILNMFCIVISVMYCIMNRVYITSGLMNSIEIVRTIISVWLSLLTGNTWNTHIIYNVSTSLSLLYWRSLCWCVHNTVVHSSTCYIGRQGLCRNSTYLDVWLLVNRLLYLCKLHTHWIHNVYVVRIFYQGVVVK